MTAPGMGSVSGTECWRKTFRDSQAQRLKSARSFLSYKEVTAEDFRDAEDKMPVRDLLEDIHTKPFPEFHHAFLMTGRAKVPPFTGKCQQVFVAAVFAFNSGKSVVQIAAIQIPINHLLKIRPPESVMS
jgi:hypothetical protein